MKKIIFLVFLSFSLVSVAQQKGVGDTTVVELITFESESVYFQQGTPTDNVWQIGPPQKTNFIEAYSAPNAIVTDTLNSYPVNNHSWFDIKLSSGNYDFYGYFHGISFYHKLHTDTLSDGGYITVSYDGGDTWLNIIHDSSYYADDYNPMYWNITPADRWETVNLYTNETLFNGEPGFSGVINQWQYVDFSWHIIPVKKRIEWVDSMIIRFNFISDDLDTGKDGWMIDDLSIFWVDLGGNIHQKPLVSDLEVYPNPITHFATIKTKNKEKIIHYELFDLSGKKLYTQIVGSSEFTFNKGKLKHGLYLMKCYFNNSKSESIRIQIE